LFGDYNPVIRGQAETTTDRDMPPQLIPQVI
jgi:hypothetical protein